MSRTLSFLLLFFLALSLQSREKEYIRLKGYYRVYQATNSMLAYFVDGMMEVYIPVPDSSSTTDKGDIFVERKFLGERRRKAPQANGDDTFVRMNLPNLEQVTLIESIRSEVYSVRNNGDVYRWADRCGKITHGTRRQGGILFPTTTIEIDNLVGQPNHEIDMSQLKIYGIVARMTLYDETETYSGEKESYTLADLLATCKQQTFFAHYKGDDDDNRIDVWSEFFITDQMTITESELKAIRKEKNHVWTFTIPRTIPRLDKEIEEAWGNMVEY